MEINQKSLNTNSKNISFNEHTLLRNKISTDLNLLLNKYPNKSVFKNKFLKQISCTDSSYYRYLNGECTPSSYGTIKKIYAFILDKPVEEITNNDLPIDIINHYCKSHITNRKNINTILAKSDTHREIYWLTSNNNQLNLKDFSEYHGMKKIMIAVNDLLQEGIITFIDDETITSSSTEASIDATFCIENITHLATKIFNKKLCDENAQMNITSFTSYKFNEDGEKQAYNKIYQLINDLEELETKYPGNKNVIQGIIYEQMDNCFNLNNKSTGIKQ